MATNTTANGSSNNNSTSNIPPPDVQVLQLVSALSNADNHDLHVQAIRARDEALSGSLETYGNLCVQLARLFFQSDHPSSLLTSMDQVQLQAWQQQQPQAANKLLSAQDESLWIQFGQLAGLILKRALLSPPIQPNHQTLHLIPPASDQVKHILLESLHLQHAPLRAVASSVIATAAASPDAVQPYLSIQQWPELVPTLLQNLAFPETIHGSLSTILKIMEDGGPETMHQTQLDALIPLLLSFFNSTDESHKVAALQCLLYCCEGPMPNALVVNFSQYLAGLSALATDGSPQVRKWVCRSIVTLLVSRTEYIQPHLGSIAQFMLNSTADTSAPEVALDACEFWLVFCSLDEEMVGRDMLETVQQLLPQLIPVLLQGMVHTKQEQEDLLWFNEQQSKEEQVRPVFHKTQKSKHAEADEKDDNSDDDDVSEDDFGDDDEDGDNEWNLRKCSAASLDSLAELYGPDPILPALLPQVEKGLSSNDPWHQEASLLALGAIASGCRHAMVPHLPQLHPLMLNILSCQTNLPQLTMIAAWTMGRYASWAVEQVQTGAQGHLLASMVEVLLQRLQDGNHRRVQVACCSSFGVLTEAAGDLLVPYLEPIYRHLVTAMTASAQSSSTKTLLVIFDTLGVMADFVGPAIGEGTLPSIYIPPLLHIWNETAKSNPSERMLLPLLEGLASIALVCGVNYQPYALETFDMCMCTIESVMLQLAGEEYIEDDQEADPIVCATDLLDGMVEGLGANFASLVGSSARYGPQFGNVLVGLANHEVPGVRMSAFALVGDLAVKAPTVLEPALADILKSILQNGLDPTHPNVCANAVWAVGEVCVRCGDNAVPLEPFASDLVQKLIPLITGNAENIDGMMTLQSVTANASAAMGRLAKVNPNFVAPELPRFLIGWCEGIAKVMDPAERRDAFEGFVSALHANPQAACNSTDAVSAILFAVVSWHMPDDDANFSVTSSSFGPFPATETELQNSLGKLMHDLKNSVGKENWDTVHQQIPVNVRQLLRETYQL